VNAGASSSLQNDEACEAFEGLEDAFDDDGDDDGDDMPLEPADPAPVAAASALARRRSLRPRAPHSRASSSPVPSPVSSFPLKEERVQPFEDGSLCWV
jgi:hypothetical protein